jgi:tetratricopeptide (TPR) repeat protein
MRVFFLAAFLLAAALAQTDPIAEAVDALQKGDFTTAETKLRAELKTHPQNADALGVLGVVLDQQKKYSEADAVYRRAVALAPRSPALLNNYGNHLVASGKLDEARDVFARVLAVNPSQPNATFQMARLALARKAPSEALRYLDRLPPGNPDAEMARMQALYELHRDAEADKILDGLNMTDPRAQFSAGVALAAAGQYAKAEEFLSRALTAAPDNFDLLYNLGLAASHAGHNERARDILQSALRQQPENVDVLYDLAAVNANIGQREAALELLAKASRLAPNRLDVQQLLARTAADLGYFGDAVQTWDRYLKLAPHDEVARRERAFALTAIGEDMEGGLAVLRAYAAKHPNDAVAHYELAIAEASAAPDAAIEELNRSIELNPALAAPRIARGLILFKQGDFTGALPDFEFAAKKEPNNAVVLDRLGQTYVALDRPAEALPALRRAAELAPNDSKTLMHLARALTAAGKPEEAKPVFARFRELGPDRSGTAHPAGLVDFLSLSPQEQMARYRAGVERTVQRNSGNAEAQVRYLKLLLGDGKTAEAASVARRIAELKASPALLSEAAGALLAAEQYETARQMLEKTGAPTADLALDLAIATSHTVNPQAGLEQLDKIPEQKRTADFHLARAEMLDAAGRPADAAAALNQALQANPKRPELYAYAAAFLISSGRLDEALALLERGARTLPDNPDIPLMKAVALEASRAPEAESLLKQIEKRWPDWYRVWLAHAVFLEWQHRPEEAGQMIETAQALGASDAKAQVAKAAANQEAQDRGARLIHLLFL